MYESTHVDVSSLYDYDCLLEQPSFYFEARSRHPVWREAIVRPENRQHAGLVGNGQPDPSLTQFSLVKTFNRLFLYKFGA